MATAVAASTNANPSQPGVSRAAWPKAPVAHANSTRPAIVATSTIISAVSRRSTRATSAGGARSEAVPRSICASHASTGVPTTSAGSGMSAPVNTISWWTAGSPSRIGQVTATRHGAAGGSSSIGRRGVLRIASTIASSSSPAAARLADRSLSRKTPWGITRERVSGRVSTACRPGERDGACGSSSVSRSSAVPSPSSSRTRRSSCPGEPPRRPAIRPLAGSVGNRWSSSYRPGGRVIVRSDSTTTGRSAGAGEPLTMCSMAARRSFQLSRCRSRTSSTTRSAVAR